MDIVASTSAAVGRDPIEQRFAQWCAREDVLRLSLQDVGPIVPLIGNFDLQMPIFIVESSLAAIKAKKLIIRIGRHDIGSKQPPANLFIGSREGSIEIWLGAQRCTVALGRATQGIYEIRMWRESAVCVGDATTSNGIKIVCDRSDVTIGPDCMFSHEIVLQSADQHGIVDLNSGAIINDRHRSIVLGEHVWVGRRAILLPDVVVGDGAIIGTGAIVTKDVPAMSVAAGVPASIVRSGTTWSRMPSTLDHFAAKYFESRTRQQTAK